MAAGTAPSSSTAWPRSRSWSGSGRNWGPWLEADTPVGPDDFSGRLTCAPAALIARSTSSRELIMHPGPGHDGPRPVARHELPAPPHPGHRHRPRPGTPAPPPGPMGLRLLSLPQRLRGAVQHHLGPDRLHRGKRCDPRGAGSNRAEDGVIFAARTPSRRRWSAARRSSTGGRVPRGRGEPGRDDHRGQHHVQRGLVAPGGEPVHLCAQRGGRDPPGRAPQVDGICRAPTHWATSTISAIRSRPFARDPGLGFAAGSPTPVAQESAGRRPAGGRARRWSCTGGDQPGGGAKTTTSSSRPIPRSSTPVPGPPTSPR